MTIEAPTRYPGLSAAGRKLILPTLVDDQGAPRHFELIGSTPVEPPAETPTDQPADTLAAWQPPRLRAVGAASSDTETASVLSPGSNSAADPELEDSDIVAYLDAALAESDAEADPSESWAAGVAAGAEAADAEAGPKDYRKFSLIEPDRRWVMVAAIILLAGILAASLTSSFTSVYAMASWVGLPAPVQWLPVVILDVAIVGFSWALMVFARRGARTWSTRLWLATVTGFSVAANFMHTFDHWDGDLSTPQAIMGVTFSSAIPLMALVATEELIRLVFKRLDSDGAGS